MAESGTTAAPLRHNNSRTLSKDIISINRKTARRPASEHGEWRNATLTLSGEH
ncbi:hypothetical protein DDI_3087 [Dickeya dianthicola RNS04.9]|nr:hypothetical protein DDI_3087 [Dickeya dianthicola RNS04.9]